MISGYWVCKRCVSRGIARKHALGISRTEVRRRGKLVKEEKHHIGPEVASGKRVVDRMLLSSPTKKKQR